MIRLKLTIIIAFAIIFAAGMSVGSFVDFKSHAAVNTAPTTPPKTDVHFPNFRDQLHLTPAQHEQVEKLWRDARSRNEALSHKFRDFDRQHDEAVMNLLTDEQKPLYEKIQKERHERAEALRGEMVRTMKETNQSIRALLTPEQQKKFDEIAKQNFSHPPTGRGGPPPMMGGPRFHRGHGPSESMPARPTTLPTS